MQAMQKMTDLEDQLQAQQRKSHIKTNSLKQQFHDHRAKWYTVSIRHVRAWREMEMQLFHLNISFESL